MNTKTQKDTLNFPLSSGNMYYEVEEKMRLFLEGNCRAGGLAVWLLRASHNLLHPGRQPANTLFTGIQCQWCA